MPLVKERCAGTLIVFELNILTKNPLKEGLKSYLKPLFHHQGAGAQSEIISTTEMVLLVGKKLLSFASESLLLSNQELILLEKWHNATGYFVPISIMLHTGFSCFKL